MSYLDYPKANPNWAREPATSKQLAKLNEMATARGMDGVDLVTLIKSQFNKSALDLTKGEMQAMFEILKK